MTQFIVVIQLVNWCTEVIFVRHFFLVSYQTNVSNPLEAFYSTRLSALVQMNGMRQTTDKIGILLNVENNGYNSQISLCLTFHKQNEWKPDEWQKAIKCTWCSALLNPTPQNAILSIYLFRFVKHLFEPILFKRMPEESK